MSTFQPFHWTCPSCRRETVVSEHNYEEAEAGFHVESASGHAVLHWRRITCPSEECKQAEVIVSLMRAKQAWANGRSHWRDRAPDGRGTVRFLPRSLAEVFPVYVPAAVRGDYEEACDIADLSPKAAATLARRALQGIVRDFWGGKGRTLKDEIDSVKEKCDPLLWDAMTSVREVGNIGAHMERDIDLIIDVEPEEAKLLISLIETLVRETYVARNRRQEQMASIMALAAAKKEEKKGAQANGAG